jgi:hypothetical protein
MDWSASPLNIAIPLIVVVVVILTLGHILLKYFTGYGLAILSWCRGRIQLFRRVVV